MRVSQRVAVGNWKTKWRQSERCNMAEAGGDAGESKPVTDPVVVEIHKKIREAFSPFDHDNNGTVDVR